MLSLGDVHDEDMEAFHDYDEMKEMKDDTAPFSLNS